MKLKFLSPWKAFDVLTDLEFFKRQVKILSSENQELSEKLEKNQNRCTELQDINQHINHELEAYKNAENKKCKKGDYCKNCAFGHKRNDYIQFDIFNTSSIKRTADYYVCEFDCCKNFVRKEQNGDNI